MSVSTASIAQILGVTDDASLKAKVDVAVAELELVLGYEICGAADFEERVFVYRPGRVWQYTHPFYELQSITIVRDGRETTVVDYQLGLNGRLDAKWYNMFKLCKGQCGRVCGCFGGCDYIKVTAKWGFGAPTGDPATCHLPQDLLGVLAQAVKSVNNPRDDIQSENTSTRSYTKFADSYKSVWLKYDGILSFYRMKRQRHN